MVLINNLTIDEINAALLHLQRSRSEVVGGTKGNTVNNITVNSSGNGGGYDVDYSSLIKQITDRLSNVETKTSENESNINQQASVNANQQSLIEEIEETLNNLTQSGITQLYFDEQTRTLTIYTTEGQYNTEIPSEEVTMSLTNNVLTFTMGGQTVTVNMPYIPASEKGAAGGVATLDSSGRLPYSQLPESAMEFKGTWNASTNDPHLEDDVGTNGDFDVCTMPGTTTFGPGNTVSFVQNDRVIYDGATSKWVKLLAGQVSSVNNLSGDVVLNGTKVNDDARSGSPTLKNKIDSVDTKASTQVDWNEGNASSLAYIKNKPSIPAAQIQSDWTQTDSTKKDFIKNKIPIWISTTAAQDNMSPIDSVTDGNMRPVTSNAVARGTIQYLGWATYSGNTIGEVIVNAMNSLPIIYNTKDNVYSFRGTWSGKGYFQALISNPRTIGNLKFNVFVQYSTASASMSNTENGDYIIQVLYSASNTPRFSLLYEQQIVTNDMLQEFRSVYTVKVNSQTSRTIPFGNWGVGLCMGNVDGAGNFAFYFARSGANSVAISNLASLGSSFFNATLSGNVVTIGTTNYKITITFNQDYTVTISWAGISQSNFYGRMVFISGNTIF